MALHAFMEVSESAVSFSVRRSLALNLGAPKQLEDLLLQQKKSTSSARNKASVLKMSLLM